MKNNIKKALATLGIIQLMVIGMMILVFFAIKLHTLDLNILNIILCLVLAPFFEEIFFRLLFIKIGRRFDIMEIAGGVSWFLFVWWHVGNYEYAGWYFAALVQGSLGALAWFIAKKYGIFYSMLLHAQYNLFVNLLNF